MKWKVPAAAVIAGLTFSSAAAAHHSFAMFNADHPMTMTGTVKEFEWVNPHSWLRILVADPASGKTLEWALELGSPAQQTRVGWTADSVKPGDKVTVVIHPLKDGARGGGLISATLPNGATLGNGGLQRGDNQCQSSRFPGGAQAGIFGSADEGERCGSQ
jgi:hypothetical protein